MSTMEEAPNDVAISNNESNDSNPTEVAAPPMDEAELRSLTEEMQSAITIQVEENEKEMPPPANIKECLMFALNEFDENASSSPTNSSPSDSNEKEEKNDDRGLAQIMRPIRECMPFVVHFSNMLFFSACQ